VIPDDASLAASRYLERSAAEASEGGRGEEHGVNNVQQSKKGRAENRETSSYGFNRVRICSCCQSSSVVSGLDMYFYLLYDVIKRLDRAGRSSIV